MRKLAGLLDTDQPHFIRLKNLALLTPADITSLLTAGKQASNFAARRDIIRMGTAIAGPKLLTWGWAAQVRDFRDGRRQILHLLLPGDMIAVSQKPGAYAATTVIALTDASVAPAPKAESDYSGLKQAYANSAEIERLCHLRQIARIGRLDAFERVADLFLELVERFRLAGLSASDTFELPLTQEMLGDCLGLTAVHVNRTLQQMRRERVIDEGRRTITLVEAARLRSLVDYQPLTASGIAALS